MYPSDPSAESCPFSVARCDLSARTRAPVVLCSDSGASGGGQGQRGGGGRPRATCHYPAVIGTASVTTSGERRRRRLPARLRQLRRREAANAGHPAAWGTSGTGNGHVGTSETGNGHVATSGTGNGHVDASGTGNGHVDGSGTGNGHVDASVTGNGHVDASGTGNGSTTPPDDHRGDKGTKHGRQSPHSLGVSWSSSQVVQAFAIAGARTSGLPRRLHLDIERRTFIITLLM